MSRRGTTGMQGLMNGWRHWSMCDSRIGWMNGQMENGFMEG